jgi:adenylate cyclase
MARNRDEFAASVMRRINDFDRSELRKAFALPGAESLQASAASTAPLGHPMFADLPLGASGSADAVAMFLDLRRFTARSFWDPPEQIIKVNVAVISELAAAVEQHGGYVLGFRGDGVFACFDGADQFPSSGVAAVAIGAAAWALDAVQNALNGLLKLSGIEPVQVRAGLDYGRLDFVRIGCPGGSEVNVLGFAANFASKCEKAALAWKIIIGESMASLLPDGDLVHHKDSPVYYTREGQTRAYRFYNVETERYLQHIGGVADELRGHPLTAVRVQ